MIKHALYIQPNPFVGRKNELAEINARLLDVECRLLTLTGLGGSGKTRLAIEVAHMVAPHFQHGVVFVGLQPLTKADLLVSTIAQAIGLILHGDDEPEAQLFSYLREKAMLLLLDNFEHLLEATPLVTAILDQAPSVKLLVTSREALNLREEWLYPLTGMTIPPSIYATSLEDYEAVQLFLHHARRMQPAFDLENERHALIRICKMAEGLPLAIELAASWSKVLSCEIIAEEMQRGLDILATTARNIPERHRSVRAVFNHSWSFLTASERDVFAKLSVFRGGFEYEAAQEVAGATLPVLASLVEKSLLYKLPTGGYNIHELLRQYSDEHLDMSGIRQLVSDLHSRYYAEYLLEREIDLKGRRQIEALNNIDLNFENSRVAWDWALHTQQYDNLHAMVEGLLWYGLFRSRQHDVNALFQSVLAQATHEKLAYLKARIAARQSYLLPYDKPAAVLVEQIEQSLFISQQYEDKLEIAICKVLLGLFLGGVAQHDFDRALTYVHDSSVYFQETGNRFYFAYALQTFAWVHYYQGDRRTAMQYAEECAHLRREIGDRYGIARILLLVAAEAYSTPDYAKAERFNREVRDIWSDLKSWSFVSFVNVNLAYLAIFRGDFAAAQQLVDEALAMARTVNIGDNIAYALAMAGVLASLEERYLVAWQLLLEAKQLAMFTSSIEALEWGMPLAACGLGDYKTAREVNQRALRFAQRLNAPARYLWHLPATCLILAHEGNIERAIEMLGLVFNHPASAPAWMEKWPLLTRLRSDLEAALGRDKFQAAWERGKQLELDTVVTEILAWPQLKHDQPSISSASVLGEPLTPREIEVLRLLTLGMTNPQIAERLVIGTGTVKTHTLNIYRKLDVANRTHAILRARELGLLS